MDDSEVESLAAAVPLNAKLKVRCTPLHRVAEEGEIARRKSGLFEVAIGNDAVAGDAF